MSTSIQKQDSPSAVAALMQAVESKDPRMLELLLNAREKWQADESRGLFNSALVMFQQRVRIVAKADSADGKAYAKMDRIWREVRGVLDECGLAVSWESARIVNGVCVLDGHIRHAAGHAQPTHFEMPIPDSVKTRDGRAVQNAAQVMSVAMTYAKRVGTCAALGIQTGDDTDGNVREPTPAASSRVAEVRDMIAACNGDEAKACAAIGVRSLDDATADQIERVYAAVAKRLQAAR